MQGQRIWMGVSPGKDATRLIAIDHRTPILKARLRHFPRHPRALAHLLEAIAMWEGRKVHAALDAACDQASCDTSLYHELFDDLAGEPLYSAGYVVAPDRRRRARDDLRGMGDFRDTRRLQCDDDPLDGGGEF